jgi:hypothetical protein
MIPARGSLVTVYRVNIVERVTGGLIAVRFFWLLNCLFLFCQLLEGDKLWENHDKEQGIWQWEKTRQTKSTNRHHPGINTKRTQIAFGVMYCAQLSAV